MKSLRILALLVLFGVLWVFFQSVDPRTIESTETTLRPNQSPTTQDLISQINSQTTGSNLRLPELGQNTAKSEEIADNPQWAHPSWASILVDPVELTTANRLFQKLNLDQMESADLSEMENRAVWIERIRARFTHPMDKHQQREQSRALEFFDQIALAQTHARGHYLDLETKGIDTDERGFFLIGFDNGEPIYSRTMNESAAVSSGAALVRQNSDFDSTFGPDIDGSGFFFNVNDHGIARQHLEFQLPDGSGSRVIEREPEDHDGHMDHVTGTVGAHGYRPDAKGMAPAVVMYSLNQQSTSDIDVLGMRYPMQPRRSIGGTTSLGLSHNTGEGGAYNFSARSFDEQVLEAPYYLHFYAAANNGGWDTITAGRAIAKNIITVASGRHVNRDSDGNFLSGGRRSGFSSRGPADDGRIKPDLTANGEGVISTERFDQYKGRQGTSMATPNASGSSILLQDYFSKRFSGHLMKSMSLKNLILHTTDDLGNSGPDYSHGWGFMNTRKAADLIKAYADNAGNRRMTEAILNNGETHTYEFEWDGVNPLIANLAWLDYPGSSTSSNDNRAPDLKYDLDLRITSPSGSTTYLPWAMPFVLNGFNTDHWDSDAVKADNTVDNIEQVHIGSPTEIGTYLVTVSHKGTIQSNEPVAYSLILSGVDDQASAPAPTLTSFTPTEGTHHQQKVAISGSGFLLGADVTLEAPGLPVIEGYSEIVTPTEIEVFLPLDRVDSGKYKIVVSNPDGQSVTAISDFTVTNYTDLLFEGFDSPSFDFETAGWTTGANLGTDNWALNSVVSRTGNSAHTPVQTEAAFTYLESPPIVVPSTDAPIKLSFEHVWDFEITLSSGHAGEDAALLMMSVDGGDFQYIDQLSSNTATGATIVSGDYWDHIDSGNPLRFSFFTFYAWTDESGGWQRTTVLLDPSIYQNKTLRFRWCLGTQNTGSDDVEGWWIDNVSLSVESSNTLPQLEGEPSSLATTGQFYNETVSFTDVDGDAITITSPTKPDWLSFTDNGDGSATLSGTPSSTDISANLITIIASDGLDSRSYTYTIAVSPAGGNSPPTFDTTELPSAVTGIAYNSDLMVSDIDGHSLSLTVGSLPSWLNFTDNGDGTATLSGTPFDSNIGTVDITIFADDGIESASKTFTLHILAPAVIEFQATNLHINESAASVTLSVNRSENSIGEISIDYSTVSGTATADEDYSTTAGTLTWLDGDSSSKSIEVQILEDLIYNESEQFTVQLSNPTGSALLGAKSSASVNIIDNDINLPPTITLNSPSSPQIAVPAGVGIILETTVNDDGHIAPLTLTWTQISGPETATVLFSSPNTEDTRVEFDQEGNYTLRLTANDGALEETLDILVTVGNSAPPGYQETNGMVVIEAEDFDNSLPVDGKEWTPNTNLSGYSGTGLVTVEPNTGTNQNTGYANGGAARLDYLVHFASSGTYHIWVRGNSSSGSDDSVHASLNDQVINTADRIQIGNGGDWTWSRSTMDNTNASLDVPTAGLHTFNLYMREDGASVDRVILTTDESYNPGSGLGPTTSIRGLRQGPAINLGGPYSAVTTQHLALNASITDDGFPETPGIVTAGWSQVSGPGIAAFADTTAANTNVTFDLPGDYILRLVANDGGSQTFAEIEISVSPFNSNLPPNAPSELSAEAVSSSQINISWTDNSDTETGFRLERSINNNASFISLSTIPANVTNYSDQSLSENTTYYYRVFSINSSVESTASNETSATTWTDREQYFSDRGIPHDTEEDEDSDNDGLSNIEEYNLGTDPNNPTSSFTVETSMPSNGNFKADIPTVPGRYYRVLFRDSLGSGTWDPLPGYENVNGTGNVLEVSDSISEAKFYRIEVRATPWE